MAHIILPDGVPGISGPMTAYPETGERMKSLAEALLRGPSSLSQAEREMIAAFVSSRNECVFCTSSHAAVARYLMGSECKVVDDVLENYQDAAVSEKLKVLLAIAGKVREDGRLALVLRADASLIARLQTLPRVLLQRVDPVPKLSTLTS